MLTIGKRTVVRSLDRHGRLRSPVTEARYRRKQAPANKGLKYPAQALRRAEVLAMLDSFPIGRAGSRNRALFTMMWRTGIRVSEATALRPIDLELDAGRVYVLHGKGDKARTPAIDRQAVAVVEEWLAVREEMGIGPTAPVFCTISYPHVGEPIFAAYVRNMVKDAARRAGVLRRVHPHALRHTHAFELLEEGFPLHYIRDQLGHDSEATTARYLRHLNPAERIAAIRERSWPEGYRFPN